MMDFGGKANKCTQENFGRQSYFGIEQRLCLTHEQCD